jgi:hypothetical protein
VHPTGGSLRVFRQFAWLEVGSGKAALSRPAHQPVTHTVSPHFKDIMTNKIAAVILITVLANVLSYSIVQANSIIAPMILVKCSNLEISILAHTSRPASEVFEEYQQRMVLETIKNLHAVVPDCEEDLTPVLDSFEQEIIQWINLENRRPLLDRNLILEPYSTDRALEIQRYKNNLLSCRYEESEHIDNWLIVFETARPYCHVVPYSPRYPIVPSLGQFFFYLVSNLSVTSLPYLAGILCAGGTVVYISWASLKNRPQFKLWKILLLSSVMLPIAFFFIILPFWVSGQMLGWILFFFLLVLWYKQLRSRRLVSSPNVG